MINPMLAKAYDPDKRKIEDDKPVSFQPKLDGVRCLVYYRYRNDGRVWIPHTYSRNGKPLICHSSIKERLKMLAIKFKQPKDIILDGELYIHGHAFQDIQGKVSVQDSSDPGKKKLQYHVYDYYCASNKQMPFSERFERLRESFEGLTRVNQQYLAKKITLVDTRESVGAEIENSIFDYIGNCYEGMMIRDPDSPYLPGKRSSGLLKYKKFEEVDCLVASIDEGQGKNQGAAMLTVFIPGSSLLQAFRVTAPGDYKFKAHVFENPGMYINRYVTVRYQELTKDGIPRFPIALGFKEDR